MATALTVRTTHDASAAHQAQQGQQAVSSAIVKGCGPYFEQAEGAGVATEIKAVRSGQAAGLWGDAATEAMPLLRAASGASSVGRRDSSDSLRRSSTSSGSSRSSLELAVLVNAPLNPTFHDAGSAGWLGSLGVEGLRVASLAQSAAHPRGGSGQLLQLPSAAALHSSTAAVHRRHGSEASPGGGSPAGGTGMSGNAAAGQSALTVRSSGPGGSLLQVSCTVPLVACPGPTFQTAALCCFGIYSCADCSCQTQWPRDLQARDAQHVDILHSILEESAAGSHVHRAADVLRRLSPGAGGAVDSQGAGGSAIAARHLNGPSSSAAASSCSSAAARQPAQSRRQAPGERQVGSQLLREEEHQAERSLEQSLTGCNAAPSSRQLRQAVEDTVEVRLLC